jgi:thiol peroxidase
MLEKRMRIFERKIMAKITFKGNPVKISGNLPAKGTQAPDFTLVKSDLSTLSLVEFRGKKVVMNIFPSIETSVCSTSVRKFNQMAAGMKNSVVLAISKDLPLAHKRFCTTEGIDNLVTLSGFRDSSFGKEYGVDTLEGPFTGLYARSVIILDEKGKVIYTQLVPETTEEPDYESAIAAL